MIVIYSKIHIILSAGQTLLLILASSIAGLTGCRKVIAARDKHGVYLFPGLRELLLYLQGILLSMDCDACRSGLSDVCGWWITILSVL